MTRMSKAEKQAKLVKSIAVSYAAFLELATSDNSNNWDRADMWRDMLVQNMAELKALGIDITNLRLI